MSKPVLTFLDSPAGPIRAWQAAPANAATIPALIGLHGYMGRCDGQYPLIAQMGQQRLSLACELRGHGLSARAPSYRLVDYADDICAIAATLDLPVVLFGHSLGALVSLVVARRLPEQVRALILEDPPPFSAMASFDDFVSNERYRSQYEARCLTADPAALLQELLLRFPQDDPLALSKLAERLLFTDPAVHPALLESRLFDDLPTVDLFAEVPAPIVVLAGEPTAGGLLPEAVLARWRTGHPDLNVARHPSAGHSILRADPTWVLQQCREWLTRWQV